MDRLNRRRAKQSRSAEVRTQFAMLSSQCKAAKEWETVFVRALVTTQWRCGAMKYKQTTSPWRSREALDRIRRTSNCKSRPLVAPASSMNSDCILPFSSNLSSVGSQWAAGDTARAPPPLTLTPQIPPLPTPATASPTTSVSPRVHPPT
jgi:hypothetical protein